MDDLHHWMPFSPFRRPEWRWLRAGYLVETGHRFDQRVDDEWVKQARDVQRRRGRSNSPAASVRVAHEIWKGDPDQRGEVEARLLAGDTDEDVASRMAMPVEVVAAYAAVFFAVRPSLTATDWVLAQAVGYSPFGGFSRELPWAAWRLAAVAGGPLLVDVVIAATSGRPLPPAFADGPEDDRHVRELARLWVAVAAAATPAAFAGVLREYRRFRAADARRLGRPARVEPMVRVQESLLLTRSVAGMKVVPPGSVGPPDRADEADGVGAQPADTDPAVLPPAGVQSPLVPRRRAG